MKCGVEQKDNGKMGEKNLDVRKRMEMKRRARSPEKGQVTEPDDPGSIPGTHVVEGENQPSDLYRGRSWPMCARPHIQNKGRETIRN